MFVLLLPHARPQHPVSVRERGWSGLERGDHGLVEEQGPGTRLELGGYF